MRMMKAEVNVRSVGSGHFWIVLRSSTGEQIGVDLSPAQAKAVHDALKVGPVADPVVEAATAEDDTAMRFTNKKSTKYSSKGE